MKLLRWPSMGGLRMGDDEGDDLVDGKEWSEKRCWEDWRRTSLDFKKRNWLLKRKCEFCTRWIVKCENFLIPVIFQDWEHAFWKMLTKSISHKVRIPVHFRTEILGGTESMLFENLSQKRIRTRGCVVRKFRTRGMGGANLVVSWLFSPVFPCFHSSSFPTYMLTQKPTQTRLEWT